MLTWLQRLCQLPPPLLSPSPAHPCSAGMGALTRLPPQLLTASSVRRIWRLPEVSAGWRPPRPHPPRDTTEQPTVTASGSDYPSVTSRVASVAPVRRPLPPDVAPDTRIRRLHLRKGAWWAWAPRHDPADDHLYGWLRLDDETQQLITSRLARLEVPELIVEKDEKATASKQVTPAYDNVVAAMREVAPSLASPHLFAHTYNNVVAAMRDVASIPTSRRLFKAVRDSEGRRFSVDAVADDARDATFLADPLCIQSSSTCSTCGASRTYAPKGKFQTPGQYADEATPECRRGIGSDSCGRTEAAGNNPMLKTLCNPDAIAAALQRDALPFIQFPSPPATHLPRKAPMPLLQWWPL